MALNCNKMQSPYIFLWSFASFPFMYLPSMQITVTWTTLPKAMPVLKKHCWWGNNFEECANKFNGLFLIFSIFLFFLLAGFFHHYPQTSKWWHFQLLTQSTLQHIWPGTWENQRLSGLMPLTPLYRVCFWLELERKIVSVVVCTITMAILCFHKIF